VDCQASDSAPAPGSTAATAAPGTGPEPAPAALEALIAAGLVSHEMIGDPARLAGEAETLRVLCSHVGGAIYRLAPYHYAFRAGPEDLATAPGGALGTRASGDWAALIEAALAADLGPDAVWVSATDLLAETDEGPDEATEGKATALPAAPVLFLRAHGAAVAGTLAADPGLQAVIDAAHAVEVARLIAAGDPAAPLARRFAVIEAGLEELREAEAARSEATALLGRLAQTLTAVVQRLDAQAGVLHAHIAREDVVAERLAEITGIASGPEAFQATLGVTLAEFLARIEARAAGAEIGAASPARDPQPV
jgi:hypothetical protein